MTIDRAHVNPPKLVAVSRQAKFFASINLALGVVAFLVNAYDHTPRNLSSVGWIIISVGILNGRRWAFFWTRFSIGVAAVIVVLGALLGGELSLTIFGRAVDNRGSVTLTLFAVGCWALYGWHAVRLEPPGACSVS